MRRAVCAWCCVWLLLACAPGLVPGAVTLPAILGDHMVLQAGQPLRIWGWAEPGEEVAVDLAGDRQVTHANAAGEWKVTLPRRESRREPVTMTVTAPSGSVTVRDILVGEVWLGSGQSNMGWPLHLATEAKTEIAEAKLPEIRLFFVPVATAATPQAKIASGWVVCSPETVPGFSAVLYFFGRELHAVLQQPVGLIASAVGGTRIEPWMPTTSFAETPSLAGEWQSIRDSLSQYSAARLEHLRQTRAWLMEVDRLQPENREFPDAPVPPAHPLNGFAAPTSLYNAMIHPIVPFTLRGVLWYQGESNRGQGMHYHDLQTGLIEGWRKTWQQGEFPFLFVQLAPFRYDDNATALPELWEAQAAGLSLPQTGMAVITDISTIGDIHPPNKKEVGRRLALWALHETYGRDVVPSGPLWVEHRVEEGAIRVKFRHAAGLKTRDGAPPDWFSIAGEDRRFVAAIAQIDGDTVVVRSPEVAQPIAVRFGWNQVAEPNLVNGAGLPASPFRTDRWTDARNAPLPNRAEVRP